MLSGNQKGLQSYTFKDIKMRISPWARGNRLADKTTKQAAKGLGVTSKAPIKAFVLVELLELTLDSSKYTEAKNQQATAEGGKSEGATASSRKSPRASDSPTWSIS